MRELPTYPRAVLFAKSPERLDERAREFKYDEPLARLLGRHCIGRFLGGFSPRDVAGEVAWVGLEVELVTLHSEGPVINFLADAGAPLATVVEVATEFSTSGLRTLAWWTGVETATSPDREVPDLKFPSREFYEQLGLEVSVRACRTSGCPHDAMMRGAFCMAHHFERVMDGNCRLDD